MYINQSVKDGVNYQYFGLFTHNFGIIKNLRVNGNIELMVSKNNVIVGLVSGIVIGENSNIQNCYSSGKISINADLLTTDYYIAAGGIVGQVNLPEGKVERCSNQAEITGQGKHLYIGGIVGSNNGGVIHTSYNMGNINVISDDDIARCGGIVGMTSRLNSSIQYCFNIGEVNGKTLTGGIAGFSTIMTLENFNNCKYINKEISGVGNEAQQDEEANNIVRDESLTEDKILLILNSLPK